MGDVFRQKYTRDGVTKTLRKWYGEVPDPDGGKPQRVALSTDKQASRSMLGRLERKAERRRAGYTDDFDETRQVPIEGLVGDYLGYLKLKGDGERHIADTRRILPIVLKSCGFDTLARFNASALDGYLTRMTRPDGSPPSARTKNTHRQAVMGFSNWCVEKAKIQFNPLERSTKAVGETVIERRALPEAQLRTLFEVARERPLREKMLVRTGENKGKLVGVVKTETRDKLDRQGRMRALLYRTAFYTGLRRGELRAMQVKHVILDGDDARVMLPGTLTKNGRPAKLPLRSDLASDLRAWIRDEHLTSNDPIFPVGRDVAKHLKRDLRAAGIPLVDENGRIFDFHAFRKCTATYLNKSGVPITTARDILRHSNIELTAGIYNDGELHDLRGALDRLPHV
jgi:integrase